MKRRINPLYVVLATLILAVEGGIFLYLKATNLTERLTGPGLAGQVAAVRRTAAFSLPGLGDVRVEAQPGGYATRSRRDGRFALKLPPGVYEVTFSAAGYLPHRERVQVLSAGPTYLWPALFPRPTGPPVPSLMRSLRSPGDGPVAYNTGIILDASGSQNVIPDGLRWEITDEAGHILTDPYTQPSRPLQLKPSPIPGSSPLLVTFVPPAPGRYNVRLYLKNAFSKAREVFADFSVEAENRSPEAVPLVIAGPNPPGYRPDGRFKVGSGLRTVLAGETVYLAAWAFDKNYPSPELYHPAGRQPDAYGKNFLPPLSRYTWRWRLYRMDGSRRSDVTGLLRADEPGPADRSPYPWFVAERPGRYLASLWAEDHDPHGSRLGSPTTLEITVLPREGALVSEQTCSQDGCHPAQRTAAALRPHMTCQSCHGPGQPHLVARDRESRTATMQVSYEAAQCGRCHRQYAEWEKSRHADGYAFGYQEIAKPLLLNCAKCHYPQGFADAAAIARKKRVDFGQIEFKKAAFPGGPLVYDFDKLPERVGQGVSCQACHDPHQIGPQNKLGLRLPKSQLCGSCHETKWQNVLLEQTAGRVGSAYEYPGRQYASQNPHNTEEKCLLCHMSKDAPEQDEHGVRRLGGHTLRMRDAGPDGKLGGFGPAPDDPNRQREAYGADDLLNLAPCRRCHLEATTFDLGGRQREIYQLWLELGRRLKELNHGVLPGYRPGDKCATCHRGGTLPFDHDPKLVLENAYTNYKLVKNDRSWGIHNYRYTKQLLEDSLRSLEELTPTR
ncbi:MAG: cytochrome c3 family protein [Betaproteobacteria bacterium]